MAYCNERIFIEDTAHSESFQRQGEPEPTHVPDLREVLKANDIQKIVYAGEDDYLRVQPPPPRSPSPAGRSGPGRPCQSAAVLLACRHTGMGARLHTSSGHPLSHALCVGLARTRASIPGRKLLPSALGWGDCRATRLPRPAWSTFGMPKQGVEASEGSCGDMQPLQHPHASSARSSTMAFNAANPTLVDGMVAAPKP